MEEIIEVIRSSQLITIDWDTIGNSFVSLSGCYDSQYQGTALLDNELVQFLNSDHQKVMLLAGHSGAGKSLFTQGLVAKRLESFKEGNPIPLWISLPHCKTPETHAIEETLSGIGFDEQQIAELKAKQSFIFVLDAYDEIRSLKNLYVSNRLSGWKAKVIITCRHEYLYWLDNFRSLFVPYEGSKPDYAASTVLYVKPFSLDQIEQYVRQHIQYHQPEWRTWEQYEQALNYIPGIQELIKTPYILSLAVEVLPAITNLYANVDDASEQKVLTQAKLYDVFTEQWFNRQEQKLRASHSIAQDEDIKPEFWRYAKSLAQLMHQHNITQVYYNPEEEGDMFDSEEDDNPFSTFFDQDDERSQLIQSACLIKQVSEHHYAFSHSTLLEYFLTRHLYDQAATPQPEPQAAEPAALPKRKRDYFNDRLLVEDDQIIQFLADRVTDDEAFKQEMLHKLYSSKFKPENRVAGANSITILVRAGVAFNGADLSGVQIPGANISGGYFDMANFKNANLACVTAHNVWIRKADFDECDLNKIKFGELAYIEHYDKVDCMLYNQREKCLITSDDSEIHITNMELNMQTKLPTEHEDLIWSLACDSNFNNMISGSFDHTVIIWSLIEQKKVKTLKGHSGCVEAVDISLDAKYAVSGSENGEIILWGLKDFLEINKKIFPGDGVSSLRISPSNEHLIAGFKSGKVIQFKTMGLCYEACLQSFDKLVNQKDYGNSISQINFDTTGKFIITSSFNGSVKVLEYLKNSLIVEISNDCSVTDVLFINQNKNILGGMIDGSLKVWDFFSGALITKFSGHQSYITSICFDSDKGYIYSGSADGTIRIWENQQKINQKTNSNMYQGRVEFFAFTQKNLAVIVNEHSTVFVWNIQDSNILHNFYTGQPLVQFIDCTKDESLFLTASIDGMIKVWNFFDGGLLAKTTLHQSRVCEAKFLNDDLILSAGDDGYIKLWDYKKGKTIFSSKKYKKSPVCIEVSPDRNMFFTAHEGGKVIVWNLSNLKKITSFDVGSRISILKYSPVHDKVFCGHEAGLSIISDYNKKAHREIIGNNYLSVSAVSLNPSGTLMVVSYSDVVVIYDLNDKSMLDQLQLPYSADYIFFIDESRFLIYVGDTFINGFISKWSYNDMTSSCHLLWSSHSASNCLHMSGSSYDCAKNLSEATQSLFYQRSTMENLKHHDDSTSSYDSTEIERQKCLIQ